MKINKILNLMNSFVGKDKIIIKNKKSFQFTDEPKFFQYTADVNYKNIQKDETSNGSSLDKDEKLSKIKSIAEGIERYSLSIIEKRKIKYGTYQDFKEKAINPIKFINYLDESEQIVCMGVLGKYD